MLDDNWDPDSSIVDRRPPDEEEFGSDTADRVEESWGLGEPGDESAEWLADNETDSGDSLDQFAFDPDPTGPLDAADPKRSDVSPATRAVLFSATAILGAAAILVAILRRRG